MKEYDVLATMTSPLMSSHDPTPVSRDERFPGPEWDQLATPWAHAERPNRERRRGGAASRPRAYPTCVAVSCAMRSISSILSSWSQSVWWPDFLRHSSHLLHRVPAIPALPDGALGTTFSTPSYNTVILFPSFCGALLVGASSPGGGTCVPLN